MSNLHIATTLHPNASYDFECVKEYSVKVKGHVRRKKRYSKKYFIESLTKVCGAHDPELLLKDMVVYDLVDRRTREAYVLR